MLTCWEQVCLRVECGFEALEGQLVGRQGFGRRVCRRFGCRVGRRVSRGRTLGVGVGVVIGDTV
jgi:hypothetical protein